MNLNTKKFFFGGLATLVLFFFLLFLFGGILRAYAVGLSPNQHGIEVATLVDDKVGSGPRIQITKNLDVPLALNKVTDTQVLPELNLNKLDVDEGIPAKLKRAIRVDEVNLLELRNVEELGSGLSGGSLLTD
jgi:hypothetical protein